MCVQLLSHVQLFVTLWTAAHQAPLSLTVSWSLPKFMSSELVIPSNISSSVAPFSFCLQSFPASGSFLMSRLFTSGGQNIGASVSATVLPMNGVAAEAELIPFHGSQPCGEGTCLTQ